MTGYANQPDPADSTGEAGVDDDAVRCGAARPAPDHFSGRPDAAIPAAPPQAPPGGRLLSVDEAVEALITGDHTGSATGSLPLDGALIEALRDGSIVACRVADGRLAFTKAAPPAAPTA